MGKQRRETKRASDRKAPRKLALKRRAESLAVNPRYCDHCGAEFTIKDDLRLPVCHRQDCRDWWNIERPKRKQRLMAQYRKEHRYSDKPKVIHVEPLPPDYDPEKDYSHNKYLEEQRALTKWNGRICLAEGCNKPVFGPNYFCDECRENNYRKADLFNCEGNHLWESATAELWVGGAL